MKGGSKGGFTIYRYLKEAEIEINIDVSGCPNLKNIQCDKNVAIIRTAKPRIIMYPLDNAVMNKEYSFQLEAESKLPVKWSAESGSIPKGLTLSESGLISGVPTKAGIYVLKVTASNSSGSTSAEFTIHVLTSINITTASLKEGTFGKTYNVTHFIAQT